MRQPLSLKLPTLDRFTMLLHGGYSVGKTYLLGDMLTVEQANGNVKFINVKGEEGHPSLAAFQLEDGIGETIETVDDWRDFVKEFKGKLRAVGIDGGPLFYRAIMKHITGVNRPPKVGANSNEWTDIHWVGVDFFTELHYLAPIVVLACTSDLSVDQITGKTKKTPDLPGRMAAGSASYFDFVFYMSAEPVGPGKVRRILTTTPDGATVVRSRTPRPLPDPIAIPDGPGGWAILFKALQNSFKLEEKK